MLNTMGISGVKFTVKICLLPGFESHFNSFEIWSIPFLLSDSQRRESLIYQLDWITGISSWTQVHQIVIKVSTYSYLDPLKVVPWMGEICWRISWAESPTRRHSSGARALPFSAKLVLYQYLCFEPSGCCSLGLMSKRAVEVYNDLNWTLKIESTEKIKPMKCVYDSPSICMVPCSGVSFCTLFTIFHNVQHFVHYL